MGTYRFILAMLVFLSHMGFQYGNYNPGIVAVVSFFIISGYTMELLHERFYGAQGRMAFFYLDRVLRIYPQYLLYLVLSLGAIYLMGHYGTGGLEQWIKELSASSLILNFFCIPLDFYMYLNLESASVLPQAWTLGLEFSFYLCFPFIFRYDWHRPVLLLSFIFYLLPYSGVINVDYWGYRLLPGTIFIFLIGSLISRGRREDIPLVVGAYLGVFCLFAAFNEEPGVIQKSVLAGILLGVPMVAVLRKFPRLAPDRFLGDLSYSIYLNHFAVFWLMDSVPQDFSLGLMVMLFSVVLAILSYFLVEKKAERLRKNCRKRWLGLPS